MILNQIKRASALALCGLLLVALTGCKTPANVAYFQDADQQTVIKMAEAQPIRVRPGDKVQIIVRAKDPKVSAMFNNVVYADQLDAAYSYGGEINENNPKASSQAGLASYTVGPDGNIDFPFLGKLHIAGMTRQELQGYIKGELAGRDLVKDPMVTVEFVNTGIDVLGEVENPGRVEVNKDQFTIYDANSMAGDLKITGMRERVKVIRRDNGEARTYVLDLTDAAKTMQSPGYYLQQNDIVYVEPNDFEKRNTTVNGNSSLNVGFWISVASLLTTVATTVGVFVNK